MTPKRPFIDKSLNPFDSSRPTPISGSNNHSDLFEQLISQMQDFLKTGKMTGNMSANTNSWYDDFLTQMMQGNSNNSQLLAFLSSFFNSSDYLEKGVAAYIEI